MNPIPAEQMNAAHLTNIAMIATTALLHASDSGIAIPESLYDGLSTEQLHRFVLQRAATLLTEKVAGGAK